MHHFICFHIGMEFNHWDLFCFTYFFLLEFGTLFLWISGRNGLYHVRSLLSGAVHKIFPSFITLLILSFDRLHRRFFCHDWVAYDAGQKPAKQTIRDKR